MLSCLIKVCNFLVHLLGLQKIRLLGSSQIRWKLLDYVIRLDFVKSLADINAATTIISNMIQNSNHSAVEFEKLYVWILPHYELLLNLEGTGFILLNLFKRYKNCKY